jgi:cytidine deaminase
VLNKEEIKGVVPLPIEAGFKHSLISLNIEATNMSNTITHSIEFKLHDDLKNLDQHIQDLLHKATEALEGSYAPYSEFHVGAALLLKNGQVVIGSNQENAAFPSGLCAERVAVFAAGAHFPKEEIVAIAIKAVSKKFVVSQPTAPCGACRQSLLEYEMNQESPIAIFLQGAEGPVLEIQSIASLLPLHFSQSSLIQ